MTNSIASMQQILTQGLELVGALSLLLIVWFFGLIFKTARVTAKGGRKRQTQQAITRQFFLITLVIVGTLIVVMLGLPVQWAFGSWFMTLALLEGWF